MTTTATRSARNTDSDYQEIALAAISSNPRNPRTDFDADALQELADSIMAHGVLEPVLVRPGLLIDQLGDVPTYELVAGERRFRAANLAGLATIPARILHDLDDVEAMRITMLENLQRRDLSPLEEAKGYKALQELMGMAQTEIAAAVHKSRPAIANRVRLLSLPEEVQAKITAGELSAAHGVALARFSKFPAVASAIANMTVGHALTSKQIESEIPYSWDLETGGAIKVLQRHTMSWDPDTTCATSCPHEAYHKDEIHNMCLKPDCFAERQKDGEKARAKRIQDALTAGAQHLDALKWGEYTDMTYKRPPGCTREQCPKFGMAVSTSKHHPDPVPICTDPKCASRLEANATRTKNKDRKQTGRALMDQLATTLDAVDQVGPREIAVLVLAAIGTVNDTEHARSAFARQDLGTLIPKGESITSYLGRRGKLPLLVQAPTDAVVKATVEAILRDEIYKAYEAQFGAGGIGLAEWYLGIEKEGK